MNMQDVHGLLVNYGGYMVLAVGGIAIASTAAAFGVFLYTQLIGEQKGDSHGHSDAGHHHH